MDEFQKAIIAELGGIADELASMRLVMDAIRDASKPTVKRQYDGSYGSSGPVDGRGRVAGNGNG